MPQSFVSNNLHIIFSTRERRPMIPREIQKRLWAYLAGIARNIGGHPMAIGGTEDHVHILAALPADLSIAKAVNLLKSNSSKWMGEQGREFAWQRGYGAFSVSVSNLASVTEYIESQEEHHRRRDFKQEFIALLKRLRIEFDPRYLFE
ncbi:MAG TPA: IS200/IS605 family transposase [Terriglobales bacterium]|nr:IS200/IS605 family transposase [Terriglobales bacterium]